MRVASPDEEQEVELVLEKLTLFERAAQVIRNFMPAVSPGIK